jgi:hypothetical protein
MLLVLFEKMLALCSARSNVQLCKSALYIPQTRINNKVVKVTKVNMLLSNDDAFIPTATKTFISKINLLPSSSTKE